MTWSAGRTAITPVVERAPTSAAPSVTAAQVSRPTGSAMTFCFGTFGSFFRTSGACASLVIIRMFLAGTSGETRSTACCNNDRPPSSESNCLGVFSRLSGQNLSPLPPAIIMTNRSFVFAAAFFMCSPWATRPPLVNRTQAVFAVKERHSHLRPRSQGDEAPAFPRIPLIPPLALVFYLTIILPLEIVGCLEALSAMRLLLQRNYLC